MAVGDCAASLTKRIVKCARDSPIARRRRDNWLPTLSRTWRAALHAFPVPTKGATSSVGHNKAVAESWVSSFGLYRLADVARALPLENSDFARKTRLFLEWNWAMFFPPDISHLGYRRTQRRSTLSQTVPDTRAPAGQGAGS